MATAASETDAKSQTVVKAALASAPPSSQTAVATGAISRSAPSPSLNRRNECKLLTLKSFLLHGGRNFVLRLEPLCRSRICVSARAHRAGAAAQQALAKRKDKEKAA